MINNDYISFLDSIISTKDDNLYPLILENSMKLPASYNKAKLEKYLTEALNDGSLSQIKDRLDASITIINNKINNYKDTAIYNSLSVLRKNLSDFLAIIPNIIFSNVESNAQDDDSGKATSMTSFSKKAKEIQDRLDAIEGRIEKHENGINDRFFSVLINTIAILGIFVAIAFAGFTGTSIITKIEFNFKEEFIRSIFFVSLIALFVYNLLLLLMYFIFVILKNFYSSDERSEKVVKFWPKCPFLVVLILDGILAVITLALFSCAK